MIKKIAVIALLCAFFNSAYSQETTEKKTKGRPDLPGNFTLELGFNFAPDAPSQFDLGFWGSRTLNIYYQYDIRIAKSNFSFVPGIGFSMERFKFVNEYTLGYDNDQIVMVAPADGLPDIRKSQLITNYIEAPIEFVFRTNPEDPARSFKFAVGGRVGYLFDSFTKQKYKVDGELKKLKDKQQFDLSQFRYGISTRLGLGNFSLFGYYNFNPLFESGKGLKENGQEVQFSTWTVGISLSSF